MAKTIFGLLGYPVKHSLSAAMHNAAFTACGIDAEYRLFEVKPISLQDFLLDKYAVFADIHGQDIKAVNVAGFNITIPHKVAAMEILRSAFSEIQNDGQYFVRFSGAVNTVKRDGEQMQYRNTDAPGFIRSLKDDLKFDHKDKTVLLLGCGGAGRAVISGLAASQFPARRIYVFENDELTYKAAALHFSQLSDNIIFIGKDNLESAAEDADLLVNATPIGMHDDDPAVIDKDLLHEGLAVYDVIYNRPTRLIVDAQSKGLAACSGLGMLLYQGVIAWEFWMQKPAPVEVMRDALLKTLKS